MHHLILLVPVVAVILFFFAPWQVALPVYLFLAVGSLWAYYKALQALKQPPLMGRRVIVGQKARVVRMEKGQIDVEYDGEIWKAVSSRKVEPGQQVVIKGVDGLTLEVEPALSSDS